MCWTSWLATLEGPWFPWFPWFRWSLELATEALWPNPLTWKGCLEMSRRFQGSNGSKGFLCVVQREKGLNKSLCTLWGSGEGHHWTAIAVDMKHQQRTRVKESQPGKCTRCKSSPVRAGILNVLLKNWKNINEQCLGLGILCGSASLPEKRRCKFHRTRAKGWPKPRTRYFSFNRLRCLGGVSAMNQRINREVWCPFSFRGLAGSFPNCHSSCRTIKGLHKRKAVAIKPLSKPFLERSMNGTKTALRDVLCCLNPILYKAFPADAVLFDCLGVAVRLSTQHPSCERSRRIAERPTSHVPETDAGNLPHGAPFKMAGH